MNRTNKLSPFGMLFFLALAKSVLAQGPLDKIQSGTRDLLPAHQINEGMVRSRNTFLVYYANEPDSERMRELSEWFGEEHHAISHKLRRESFKFPRIVRSEISELIHGARSDSRLGLIVFSNQHARNGKFQILQPQERELQLATWKPIATKLKVFQSHPLSHPNNFHLALRAISDRLGAQTLSESDFVLITKSHGMDQLAVAQTYAQPYEATSAAELAEIVEQIRAADGTGWDEIAVENLPALKHFNQQYEVEVENFESRLIASKRSITKAPTTIAAVLSEDSRDLASHSKTKGHTLGASQVTRNITKGITKKQYLESLLDAGDRGMKFQVVLMEACDTSLSTDQLAVLQAQRTPHVRRLYTSDVAGLRYRTIDYSKVFKGTKKIAFADRLIACLDQTVQEQHESGLPPTTATDSGIVVIAHRGASGYLPEHTLEATVMAHAQGVNFIEQDVVLTKDHQPIVLHDIHLDTVTDVAERFPRRKRKDGRFYAIDFLLKEIRSLHVSERMNLDDQSAVFPSRFPSRKSSFKIPTLGESIELIQGLNLTTGKNIGIYTEIKKPRWHRDEGSDITNVVLATLKKYGYEGKHDNAYLQCFDPRELRRIKAELKSDLRLVQLIGSNDWDEADVDYTTMLTSDGVADIASYADGIGPWMPYVISGRSDNGTIQKTELVHFAHHHQLQVHPFTFRADSLPDYVDDFEELVTLFVEIAEIDGLFSDHADKVLDALE